MPKVAFAAKKGDGTELVGASVDVDCVLHLSMNEGVGDVVHDISGYGNDGSIVGSSWVHDGHGYALSFDGKDDYVDCGNDLSLNTTGAITIVAWINPLGWGEGNTGRIVDKNLDVFGLYLYNTSGQETIKLTSFTHSVIQQADNNAISLNQWQHVVVTYDQQNVKFYVNGLYKGGGAATGSLGISSDNLVIGNSIAQDGTFNGTIGKVKIYTRALSAAEILHSFEASRGKYGL